METFVCVCESLPCIYVWFAAVIEMRTHLPQHVENRRRLASRELKKVRSQGDGAVLVLNLRAFLRRQNSRK
jgi:hypothetical protein